MTNQASSPTPTMLPAVSPEPSANYFPRHVNTPQLTSPRLSSPSTHPVEWPELAPPATTPTTVRSEPTVPPQPPTTQQPPASSPPLVPELAMTPTVAPSVTPPLQPVVSTQKHHSEPTIAPSMTQPHPAHPMPSGNGVPQPSGYGAPPVFWHNGVQMPSGSGAPPFFGHNGWPMPSGYGAPPFSGHDMPTSSNGPSVHTGTAYNGAPKFTGRGYNGAPMYTSSGYNGTPTHPGIGSTGAPMHPRSGWTNTPNPYSVHPTYGTPMPSSSYYPPMHPNSTSMYNGSGYSYGSCVWNPPPNLPMHGQPPFAMSQPPVYPAPWSDNHHPNFAGWSNASHSYSVHAPTPSVEHASTVFPNIRPSSPLRTGASTFSPSSPTVAPPAPVPERAPKGVRYLCAQEIKAVLDDHGYPSDLIHKVTAPAYCTNPDARDLSYHVGGKPTSDFRGLEPSTDPSPATCKRSVCGGAKGSAVTAGLSLKLTRDVDFPAWLDKFTAACSVHGLDTCLYLNPRDRGMQLIGRCLPFCDDIIMHHHGQLRSQHMQTNRLYLSEERLIHKKLVDSIDDTHIRDFYELHAHLVDEKPTAPIIVVLFHLYVECTGGTAAYMNSLKTKFNRLQVSSSAGGLRGALTQYTFLLKKLEVYGHYPLHAMTRLLELTKSANHYEGFALDVGTFASRYHTTVPSTFEYDSFHQQVDFLRRHSIHPIEIAQSLSKSYRTYTTSNHQPTSNAEYTNQAHYTSVSSDTTSAALAKAQADHQENIQRGKESKRRLDELQQRLSVSSLNSRNNNNRNNNNNNSNNNNRNSSSELRQNHSVSTNNNRNDRGNGSSPSRRNSSSHPRGNREGRDRHGNSSSPRRNRHRSPSSQSLDNSTTQTNSSNNQNNGSTPAPTLTANYVIEPPSEDEDYMPMVYLAASIPRPEAPTTPPMVRVSIPPVIDPSLLAPIPESDHIPFVFDMGATDNIVPDATAFLPGTLRPLATAVSVLGLTSRAPVAGKGTIAVDFPAIDGSSRRLEMDAYYIPDPTIPYIISPQSYLAQQKARNNNEWPEQFTVTSDDACCFVHHPKAPDFWIPKTPSGLFVGYGTLASASASTTPSIAPKLLTKGSRAASDHNSFTGRQSAMHSLATEATRPSGTQRAPTLPQREPTLPQREPTLPQREPSSPQREPSSPQREPSSPQREPYPFQGEITESEHVDTAHESSSALAPYNEYCSIAQDPTPYTTFTNLDIYDNDVTPPVLGPTLSKRGYMNFVPSPSDGSFHVSIDRRWDPSIDERECQDIYINDIYPALSIV